MKKRLLSLVTAIALVAGSFSWAPDVQAADINNIPAPTYSIQKTADGSDVFVTAYNVKDFGADATGASDCTEIFQKLLNKTGELGGGVVYVPSGRYKISGSLRIPKGVTLRGDWTKPVKGKSLTSGTVLMAYVGRGQGETDTPFVEMEPETGCMNLTVWYPEQNPNDIVKYSPTIRLGVNNYFGNEYSNVKNVTLVNSYIGVWYNRNNFGASPVINGVYGTPLKKGVEIDCIADVGRIENVHFSPEYWKGSGFANAPSDDSVRDYVYENATGIVMRRNDWSYTCYVDVEGYNIGYNTNFSYDGNRSTPNGHHYHFNLTNCKNGIVFDTSNYVGILFDDIKMYNCESGIVVKEGTSDVVQFSKAKLTCRKYAVNIAKTSSTKLLMNDCTIEQGVVNIDGGTLMSTGCAYNNKAPQIAIGSLGRVSLAGNSFKVGREIVNKSIYKSDLSNETVELKSVPTFDDSKAEFKSHAPSGERITVVTSAPYNTDISRDHGGASDCTASIQNALNDTKNAGGGIVYLPAGHYRLNRNITIPSGVELRGANDVSTVPHGAGSILEVYGGRGDANGTAAIRIESNAGIRAVTINYPEQTYKVDGNGVFDPVDYPFTMQGMGENVYVINVGVRAATRVLDLSTYRCNNHYVDFLTGHVTKECVRVGGGSKGGVINNLMFNTLIYAAGRESKFGGFPNSPANVEGSVYDQQLNDLEFIVLGDCDGETLYNCFPYGAHIGVKLINQGGGGPQNLVSMGLGVDGSRKAIYFDSGLNGTMDFINNQIVSLNNDQPITRYIEAKSGSDFTANFYNTDCWGYPEKSIVLGDGCGTVNMYTANFQARGYNTALDVSDGSALNLYASSFNANGSTFSSGTGNIAMVATVADYSEGEAGSFKANVAGFGSSSEISGESPASAIDRSGWRASASTHNEDAYKSLDGDLYSQWTTMDAQTNGQWYQVDLGQMTEFDTIVTTLGRTNDVPRGYVVKVSDDGTNWREVATGENNNIYSVGNQKARYVRIEQTMSEGHWWAVYEFYVLKSESYDPGEGEEIPTTTVAPTTTVLATTSEATSTVESTETASTSGKPDLAKVKIKKIYKKKKSAKKIKIKVRKVKGAKGYYVAVYKTKKLAKKNKKPLLKKYYKKNKTIFKISSKKLKNKSKLFVRVRAYAKIDDEVFYGKWSKVVAVK